ncbi:MAG: GGDEF domain-containing protein [Lachnospiraceae bacterium]|nr:GGDEF domain-containing protein [Lachnospiraceae bacterium]
MMNTMGGMIHIFFAALFWYFRVWPMVIFNVISPICYFKVSGLYREGKLLTLFLFDYFEISIHAIAASICVGWDFGFEQFIFTLVPYGYFICYELYKGRKRYLMASILGGINAIASIAVRWYTFRHKPLYDLPVKAAFYTHQFNSILTYTVMFFFLVLFLYELQQKEAGYEAKNAVLNHEASVDPLTGMLNRRSMQSCLESAYLNKSKFSVAMIDLDDFKKINDSYGHDAGDLVLKEMTRIVRECVPEGNPICRWGGEEVLIMFDGMGKDEAAEVCEKIRASMEADIIDFYDKKLNVTMTIGVAPQRMAYSIDETIAEADEKMYHGKQSGKNRVVANYKGL